MLNRRNQKGMAAQPGEFTRDLRGRKNEIDNTGRRSITGHAAEGRSKLVLGHRYAAFRAGASAYVLKNAAVSELITAIRSVLTGKCYISSELRQRFGDTSSVQHEPDNLFGDCLTPRQREVLQLIAEGKMAKEIAYILGISVKTAEFHKSTIMQTLGLRSTAELTRYAIEHRIA